MKRILPIVLTALVLVAGLGFGEPGPEPPSNTSDVTGTIFEEANDQFLSVTEFGELESSVLFLQFDMPGASSPGFEIGAGTTLGGLYLGAYYGAVIPGKVGQLGSNNSEVIEEDRDFVLSGNVITGRESNRTVETDYNLDSENDVQAIVGIGDIGIGVSFLQDSRNGFGSYGPAYTFPTGVFWNPPSVGTGAQTATTFTAFDSAGEITSVTSEEYALGEDRDNRVRAEVSGGIGLALGEMSLAPSLSFGIQFDNNTETAAFEEFSRVVGSNIGIAYTPSTALGDAEASEITDLTTYTYEEASEAESIVTLDPAIGADWEMPLNDVVLLEAGLDYGLSLPIYSASYTDNAGEEQSVSGRVDTYSSTNVVTATNTIDPSLIKQTTTTVSVWNTEEYSSTAHAITPSAGVVVSPSERFRFGVEYSPVISFFNETTTYAGEAVERIEVQNDDDGVVEDTVSVTTVSRAGYTETYRSARLDNNVNTAAQFFLVPDRIRVNLGAEVFNRLVFTDVTDIVTNGATRREVREASGTLEPTEDDFVLIDSEVDDDIRATPDARQTVRDIGISSVTYDAGFTYFFDDNMFLDLSMGGSGGDIWNTGTWSLEMTILF